MKIVVKSIFRSSVIVQNKTLPRLLQIPAASSTGREGQARSITVPLEIPEDRHPLDKTELSTGQKFRNGNGNAMDSAENRQGMNKNGGGSIQNEARITGKSNLLPRTAIDAIFHDQTGITSRPKFEIFVKEWLPKCNVSDLSYFVMKSGKKSRHKPFPYMKYCLHAVAERLQHFSSYPWKFSHISSLIYGLQCLEETDNGYLSVVSVMTRVTREAIERGEIINDKEMSKILFGLQNNQLKTVQSRELLSIVTVIVEICQEPIDAQSLSNALYGLKRMNNDSEEVNRLLSVVARKIQSCRESLLPQHIGNALYGLQGMTGCRVEFLSLLLALVPKIQSCTRPLSAQEVGNALYGLQGVSSDHTEAVPLLRAITRQVQNCTETLRAQELSNALYGLQKMRSNRSEVLSLLSALIPKAQQCNESLSAQAVGNIMYGLQGMSSDCEEVLLLLTALAPNVNSCKQKLNAQEVGNALYGLQSMSSDRPEVLSLLSVVTPKVRNCSDTLDAQAVSNALYGMQGMSSACPDVLSLLLALAPKVHECKQALTLGGVSNALYGMQGMFTEQSCQDIVSLLLRTISAPNKLKSSSNQDLANLGRSVALILPMLQTSLDRANARKWEEISDSIAVEVVERKLASSSGSKFQSALELRIHGIATEALKGFDVVLSHNELLFGLMECDLIIRTPLARSRLGPGPGVIGGSIINIEIDGLDHQEVTKMRYCKLRDAYLESRGVVVWRLTASRCLKMRDEQISKWLLDRVATFIPVRPSSPDIL